MVSEAVAVSVWVAATSRMPADGTEPPKVASTAAVDERLRDHDGAGEEAPAAAALCGGGGRVVLALALGRRLTAPLLVMEAPAPTLAVMSAPEVTSAWA